MARSLWFVELVKKSFQFRFLIAKLTRIPLIGKLFEKIINHILFKGDYIIYLPKNQIIKLNLEIKRGEEIVLPSQIIDHFIEKSNYHWIMNFCLCRAGNKCKNYPIDLGCLFLGEAILGINPQLGRQVTKKEAFEHIKRCREAGLVHMIGRNKLDTIWLNIGPGNKLLTVCNCCECCCLWRVLPDLAPEISNKVNRMPGITVKVTNRCIGCGSCETSGICFVNAIHLVDDRAIISEACRGCGRCVSICPQKAIEIFIEDRQLLAKLIDRIDSLVDVS